MLEIIAAIRMLNQVKYLLHFTGNLLIGGEQWQVGVDPRRALVKIARANVTIEFDFPLFLTAN